MYQQAGWRTHEEGEILMQQRFSLIALLVLLVAMIASGTLYKVDEAEQVIITQFGEPMKGAMIKPGLNVKLPFNQVRRRYGSRDHRVLADVGEHRSVGRLLLVDAPHLETARRLAHGTAGMAQTQHDIWREVHPDVGEIKEHVIEEQETKLKNPPPEEVDLV